VSVTARILDVESGARLVAGLAVALAIVAAGCGGEGGPEVSVEPNTSAPDEPLRIAVRELEPRTLATLRLASTDAAGVRWSAAATFRVGTDGTVDVRRTAPMSGSYEGVAAMGLVWSMQPTRFAQTPAYWWGRGERTFELTVRVGDELVASTTFRRTAPAERATTRDLTVDLHGFRGVFFAPRGEARRPAVLVLGGSGGGLPLAVSPWLLAGRGHPVLALAYFGEEGLPVSLSRIPLEYFERALEWLRRQPQVDGGRAVVWGVSRGSEAALLLGVHFPRLVGGVVAAVPSNVSLCDDRCVGPAWTLNGAAVPYTSEFNDPRPTDDPRAVIPVERIRGPVLLPCGELDRTWDSCAYARAIAERLEARGHGGGHSLHAYPRGGHGIGSLAPYESYLPADPDAYAADQRARADVWPRLLAFLAQVGKVR
jgi:dienelactone hydrolase